MSLVKILFILVVLAGSQAYSDVPASPEEMRSPVNQVFQWKQDGEFSQWSDGSTSKATAYLWVPEKCQKLRGLLILCVNVPEQMLAGHPAIRQACTDNDLGIVFCTKSFYNFKKELRTEASGSKTVAFLQQLLDGLAKDSGYPEVATIPWLPIGESGHLLMVDALVESAPERCIAGIWLKNPHLPPKNRTTPALVIFGSSQEWSQDKKDVRTLWNDVTGFYNGTVLGQLKSNPNWPLSVTIDGGSGHFDCSEKIVHLVAGYIDTIAKLRLSKDGSVALQPVSMDKGYRADIPVPGHEHQPITLQTEVSSGQPALPWFPSKDLAAEAQTIANINWQAQTQLPAFINGKGEHFLYTFNGITSIALNHKPKPLPDGTVPPMLESEPDGITFTLKGQLLDKIPDGFVGAGEPLAQAPGPCVVEWLSGCVEPLGAGRFRIALDRTWPSPLYVGVRHAGTDKIREIFQPGQIDRAFNTDGKTQTIKFDPLPDVKAGTASMPLSAKSDADLPVSYFVDCGPAIVQDGKLVFTAIPPKAAFPITVTVAAWQGGRYAEPQVQQAAVVRQTFHLTAP